MESDSAIVQKIELAVSVLDQFEVETEDRMLMDGGLIELLDLLNGVPNG